MPTMTLLNQRAAEKFLKSCFNEQKKIFVFGTLSDYRKMYTTEMIEYTVLAGKPLPPSL